MAIARGDLSRARFLGREAPPKGVPMSEKIVVLGGGFAGVEAAIQLRKEGYTPTLVSARDYIYLYPVSIWIPVGELAFEDACVPLAGLAEAHHFNFQKAEVQGIDVKAKKVQTSEGEIEFDGLIIAFGGAKTRPEGIEHTYSICSEPEQSKKLKEALDRLVAEGHGKIAVGFGGNPKDPSAVRGGPGFEFIFNVHQMLKKKGLRDRFELTMFAPMEKPGIRMGTGAFDKMGGMFERMAIHRQFGTKIKAFEPDGVRFADDSKLDADLMMFIPAGAGHPVAKASGLPVNEAGFIETDEGCRVALDPELENPPVIFAVGDAAALQGPAWKAKQGHLAEIMAKVAAQNMGKVLRGDSDRKSYVPHVSILCLMDSGDGASLVKRDSRSESMLPLPIVGHWMKKGWGWYWKNSKFERIPRFPGM